MRDGRLLCGTRLRVRSTLLVKDSGELIEGILSATTERRDILRRILPYVDGAGRDGRPCPAARIALGGHGDVRCNIFGAISPYCFKNIGMGF